MSKDDETHGLRQVEIDPLLPRTTIDEDDDGLGFTFRRRKKGPQQLLREAIERQRLEREAAELWQSDHRDPWCW